MAWTVTFTPDPAKLNVGTATATWDSGQGDQFVFSGRVDSTSIPAFVAEAQAAQVEYVATAAAVITFQTQLASALNGVSS